MSLRYRFPAVAMSQVCVHQLRQDFRVFHVPRIQAMRDGGASFRPRRVALVRDYICGRDSATLPQPG